MSKSLAELAKGKTIILADDGRDSLRMFKMLLKITYGDELNVITTESGREALKIVQEIGEKNPEQIENTMLITDNKMYDMDGVKLIEEIRKGSDAIKHIEIVMHTGDMIDQSDLRQAHLIRKASDDSIDRMLDFITTTFKNMDNKHRNEDTGLAKQISDMETNINALKIDRSNQRDYLEDPANMRSLQNIQKRVDYLSGLKREKTPESGPNSVRR